MRSKVAWASRWRPCLLLLDIVITGIPMPPSQQNYSQTDCSLILMNFKISMKTRDGFYREQKKKR